MSVPVHEAKDIQPHGIQGNKDEGFPWRVRKQEFAGKQHELGSITSEAHVSKQGRENDSPWVELSGISSRRTDSRHPLDLRVSLLDLESDPAIGQEGNCLSGSLAETCLGRKLLSQMAVCILG